ncbi:MAG: hypothetical protein LUQ07_00040 [Methanospirillum sp.]|nr:hypothetical protein [Methanospirillum sp.]
MSETSGSGARLPVCPFISAGSVLIRCLGTGCAACRTVVTGEGTIRVCALIDRDFSDTWEVSDGIFY